MSNNVIWHEELVTRDMRQSLNGHRAVVIWFTGLSGSGKSTLAHALEKELYDRSCRSFVFDGDNVRHGLCSDLSFSEADRHENLRRIGEMVNLFTQAGVISLSAFISPFESDRDRIRSRLPAGDFMEVYCKCSVEKCESRDVKGLYAKARAGEIENYTGISSPYEQPLNPELVLDTENESLEFCVTKILDYLVKIRVLTNGDQL